ncbi:unnamed protein product, partial [Nesidiocoris tenuis]
MARSVSIRTSILDDSAARRSAFALFVMTEVSETVRNGPHASKKAVPRIIREGRKINFDTARPKRVPNAVTRSLQSR